MQSLLVVGGVLLTAGCSDYGAESADDAIPNGPRGGEPGANDGDAGAAAEGPLTLPFAPSNLPPGLSATIRGDMRISAEACGYEATIDTGSGKVSCLPNADGKSFSFQVITQTDASMGEIKLGVVFTRNFVIETTVRLQAVGPYPLVIVALDEARIMGRLVLTPGSGSRRDVGNAGGYSSFDGETRPGLGPGGGGGGDIPISSARTGAGGGAFCGSGGHGGNRSAALGTGGSPYGRPALVPLLGGSAGGGSFNTAGGAGGGALQIVAGRSITTAVGSAIHAGGAGGDYHGGAGGAGGAILLESLEVVVHGTLAANGGGGGGGGTGAGNGLDPIASTARAGGGSDSAGAFGGDGAAGDVINGDGGGSVAAFRGGGGGGGGTGRIRINSRQSTLDGILSPTPASSCATMGGLP